MLASHVIMCTCVPWCDTTYYQKYTQPFLAPSEQRMQKEEVKTSAARIDWLLSERIRDQAIDLYDKIGQNGKPASNEFTVLAGIFAENSKDNSLFPLALATGTKCCGQDIVCESAGAAITDSHAEVLARRGLVRYLTKEAYYLLQDIHVSNPILEKDCVGGGGNGGSSLKLKDSIRLHLIISDSPCGDATIYECSSGDKQFTGAKQIVKNSTSASASQQQHYLSSAATTTARTIATTTSEEVTAPEDFISSISSSFWFRETDGQNLRTLRIKSGRSDIPERQRTTSLSCSDKICRWAALGLQGSIASLLMGKIPLSSVLVGRDPLARYGNNNSSSNNSSNNSSSSSGGGGGSDGDSNSNKNSKNSIISCSSNSGDSAELSLNSDSDSDQINGLRRSLSRVAEVQLDSMPIIGLVDFSGFKNSKCNMEFELFQGKNSNVLKSCNSSNSISSSSATKLKPCGFSINWIKDHSIATNIETAGSISPTASTTLALIVDDSRGVKSVCGGSVEVTIANGYRQGAVKRKLENKSSNDNNDNRTNDRSSSSSPNKKSDNKSVSGDGLDTFVSSSLQSVDKFSPNPNPNSSSFDGVCIDSNTNGKNYSDNPPCKIIPSINNASQVSFSFSPKALSPADLSTSSRLCRAKLLRLFWEVVRICKISSIPPNLLHLFQSLSTVGSSNSEALLFIDTEESLDCARSIAMAQPYSWWKGRRQANPNPIVEADADADKYAFSSARKKFLNHFLFSSWIVDNISDHENLNEDFMLEI